LTIDPGDRSEAEWAAKALRPDRRRQLVDDVRSVWSVSIRRACRVIRADRSSYHYRGAARIRPMRRSGCGRSPDPCTTPAGGLGCEREARMSPLQGVGTAAAAQGSPELVEEPPKRRAKAKLREGRYAACRMAASRAAHRKMSSCAANLPASSARAYLAARKLEGRTVRLGKRRR